MGALEDYLALKRRFEAQGLKIYRLANDRCHNMEEVTLNLPGRHNVQNALAAIAVGTELGIADAAIAKEDIQMAWLGVFFDEQNVGQSPGNYAIYLRGTDGSPAVRLGDGASHVCPSVCELDAATSAGAAAAGSLAAAASIRARAAPGQSAE